MWKDNLAIAIQHNPPPTPHSDKNSKLTQKCNKDIFQLFVAKAEKKDLLVSFWGANEILMCSFVMQTSGDADCETDIINTFERPITGLSEYTTQLLLSSWQPHVT